MQYSEHAEGRLILRNVTKTEVERIIANPARGIYQPKARDAREHLGYADDGRPVTVVTDRAVTTIITIMLV